MDRITSASQVSSVFSEVHSSTIHAIGLIMKFVIAILKNTAGIVTYSPGPFAGMRAAMAIQVSLISCMH